MTFLRKRSRSQCSTSSQDEDLAIIRKETRDVKKYSGMSSNTQVTARDYDIHDSCVLRNFPKHKSAHLRFLAWVQYTRQFPDHSITDDERRTCPLLWCRTIFHDQEAMLKHVWNCEHLSKGLYWCFQCQKPERVGRFQCRRCQGGSSKTDRIATVAKRMFSALGSRRAFEKSPATPVEDRSVALSKISEASEVCESWSSAQYSAVEETMEEGRPSYWDPPCLPELPNTCLPSEMENNFIVPEMSGGWDQITQELSTPKSPRSASRRICTEFHKRSRNDHIQSQLHNSWSQILVPSFASIGSPSIGGSPRPTRSILPRLNTKTQFEALRQGDCSIRYTDNPMSATVVSPLSATGGFDYGTLDALDISPTDSEASGKSLFSDSGYSSATFESWNDSDLDFNTTRRRQDFRDKPEKEGSATERFIGWPATFNSPVIFPQISEVTQINTMTLFTDMSVSHSASRCNVSEKPKDLSPHWSDAQSLVKSFSEVLDQHLQHSRAALQQMASTTITRELLSMSSSSIISIGVGVLAGLLEGIQPNAILHIFAFTHIAYAFAIAIDHDSSKVQTSEWFEDSLSLLGSLTSEKQRLTYTQIVRVIWQPRVSSSLADSHTSERPSSSKKPKENRLITACKHFLDIQESLSYREQSSASNGSPSQFDFVKAAFVNKVKSHKLFDALIKKNSIEAFIEDVVEVEKRLNNGLISNVRQLELELIYAGKLASQSDTTYNRFLSQVNEVCDKIRAEDKSSEPRTSHHLKTIAMTQQLLPEDDEIDAETADEEAQFELDGEFLPDSGYNSWDLTNGSGEVQDLVNIFAREADAILNQPHPFGDQFISPQQQLPMPSMHDERPMKAPRGMSSISLCSPTTSSVEPSPSFRQPRPQQSLPATPSTPTSTTANKYRCHCGYEPTGSEEWKASNFARHKRTQHASAAKSYRCSFPGCTAKYRRSDNLKAHLRLKGHGNEDLLFCEILEDMDAGDGEEGLGARPSKRRKRGDGGEIGLR